MSRKEIIGAATLYLGDCREILPTLGKVDAVVTDPPYGIDVGKMRMGNSIAFKGVTWDENRIGREVCSLILDRSRNAIIWGGQYYTDVLPPMGSWLVWDKETSGVTSFADFEMAWTNLKGANRLVRHLWSGPYMKEKEVREHPTQKPLGVMRWCMGFLDAKTILDPFMGSGSTGCVAVATSKQFIGIEIEPRYFDIACKRIEEAQRQSDQTPSTGVAAGSGALDGAQEARHAKPAAIPLYLSPVRAEIA